MCALGVPHPCLCLQEARTTRQEDGLLGWEGCGGSAREMGHTCGGWWLVAGATQPGSPPPAGATNSTPSLQGAYLLVVCGAHAAACRGDDVTEHRLPPRRRHVNHGRRCQVLQDAQKHASRHHRAVGGQVGSEELKGRSLRRRR